MKYFDAHAHVFEALKGYSGKGEMTALGGGKGAWATGEICKMIPPALGEDAFTYDTAYQLLKDNDVEKAVLLQGSYYGFQNDYVSKAVNAHPDMFIGAGTFDPFAMYAEKLYDRLTHELGFRVLKFETSAGCGLMSYHDTFSVREVFSPLRRNAQRTDRRWSSTLEVPVWGVSSRTASGRLRTGIRNFALWCATCWLPPGKTERR